MRVLQLITSLHFGGAERLLVELAPRMAASGAAVRVLSVTSTIPLASVLQRNSIEVRSLNCHATIYQLNSVLRAVRDFSREIDNFRPDVIHSHLYMADLIARLASPRSARLITTLHGIDSWWAQKSRLRSLAKTWVDSWSASLRNTRAIAVSEPVATAAFSALKLPRQHCRVIRNGIDAGQFACRERALPVEPIIIQVGRLAPEKAHDTSLQAFARVLQTHPRCRLQFVGQGPLERPLRELAATLGIAAGVEFLGPRSDMSELLARAHVFWMPSRSEGLPLACLEAMATGLPVIATSVGGLPAILADGVGRLITPDQPEQLARVTVDVLQSYDAAQAMGKRASARVAASYSVQNTARDYLNAYSDLLSDAW
jgi:glycosyltransferase involved in cell wall biosynthesis